MGLEYPWILVVGLLFMVVQPMKLVVKVDRRDGPTCFYQSLTANEKYMFQATSKTHSRYRMDVMQQTTERWVEVVIRQADSLIETISKTVPVEGVYMFCLSNYEEQPLPLIVEVLTGLQLMNFQHLPSLSDQENLHREVDWLENQKNKLLESINRIDTGRLSYSNIADMMSTKLVIFAILGLVFIIGMNLVFYQQAKKTLKSRKLI